MQAFRPCNGVSLFEFHHRLHNLLKQYGGIPEYIKLNTEAQNQQQLKNFDLSEYRYVYIVHIFIEFRTDCTCVWWSPTAR